MTIAALCSGLADAAKTIPNGDEFLRASDLIPASVNPPVAIVFDNGVVYDLDMGDDGSTYNFIIRVYAGAIAERPAQQLLHSLAEPSGSGSLKAVIEANTALRALCDWVDVKAAGRIQVTNVGGDEYLTRDWTVEIGT